jgi:hypothetical protein
MKDLKTLQRLTDVALTVALLALLALLGAGLGVAF